MSGKSTPARQEASAVLGNGVALSVEKQIDIMWKVSARLDLLLEEYDNILSRDEAAFILDRLKSKYKEVDMSSLLLLCD